MNYGTATTGTLATTGAAVSMGGSPWLIFAAVSVAIVLGSVRFLVRRHSVRP